MKFIPNKNLIRGRP